MKGVSALLACCACLSAQTTIATSAGGRWSFTYTGAKATAAPFGTIAGVTQDRSGNTYLSDLDNDRVFRITNGIVSYYAGSGTQGYSGDGMAATAAALYNPGGLAVDAAGNLYICDNGNYRIRKVTAAGTISTVAGTGTAGFAGDGGPAVSASIGGNLRIAFDGAGNLYISDADNHRIRRVTADGTIHTFAGNGVAGFSGDGGPAAQASMQTPSGITFDGAGNLYFADIATNRVRRISPTGQISTVAGNGAMAEAGDGGPAAQASLYGPTGVAADKAGAVLVADQGGSTIRRIDPVNGLISTFAGSGQIGLAGDGGAAASASLYSPVELWFTVSGALLIADSANFRVRQISGITISTIAGNGNYRYSGDGGAAGSAGLPAPDGIVVDPSGNLNICDNYANRVRTVNQYGVISLVAGTAFPGFSGDGGLATAAALLDCDGIAADGAGNLYFADTHNYRIRKISATGVISTVAGNGTNGFSGDGGPATSAALSLPQGVAVDSRGNLYIADTGNNRIRKVQPTGSITTLAGTGAAGFSGDGGPAVAAALNAPSRISVDSGGNVFFSDTGNNAVRRISAAGVITRVAGNGTAGFSGDGGPAVNAMLWNPNGVAIDAANNLLIADTGNLRIRRVDGNGKISTIAGNGTPAIAGDGRAPTSTGFVSPVDVAVDAAGNIYIADPPAGRVRRIQPVPSSLVLSQTGLTFTAAVDGAAINAAAIKVLNGGAGTIGWAATASMLSGSTNWLSVAPAKGTSTGSTTTSPITVSVNPAGLAAGSYYGKVQVTSPGIANSPRFATIVLNVLSPNQSSGASVSPASVLFPASAGGANPPAQTVAISLLHGNPVTFTAAVSFPDNNKWLSVSPLAGRVVAGTATNLTLQANTAGLAARTYTATVNLSFSDGSTRNVPAAMTVAAGAASGSAEFPHASCAPTKLLPVLTTIGQGFSVAAGWPSPIEVQVVDDCGNALSSGGVTATFSNGDPPLALSGLQNGTWSATWAPRSVATTTVTVTAQNASTPPLTGQVQVSGQLNANTEPPILSAGGFLNAASFASGEPATPGALMAIFGSNLATGSTAATALPLPTLLSGAQAIVGGLTMPLLYAGPGQLNAMVPFTVAADRNQQLIVQNGNTLSVPEPVSISPGAPGAFTRDGSGSGQAIVVAITPDGSGYVVTTTQPAHPGSTIVIYCTGLGSVQTSIRAGQSTPLTPLAAVAEPVALNIGSMPAPVLYAGLVPTFSGLYQVNATIPAGAPTGVAVPLMLTAGGVTGPPVTIAIQ